MRGTWPKLAILLLALPIGLFLGTVAMYLDVHRPAAVDKHVESSVSVDSFISFVTKNHSHSVHDDLKRTASKVVSQESAAVGVSSQSSSHGEEVDISVEYGVPDAARQDASIASKKTIAFFADELNLYLNHKVRIFLVPDAAAYVWAQVRELNSSQENAEWMEKNTAGLSSGDVIIQKTGSLNSPYGRMHNISHEMVHQFQRQLVGRHSPQVWMMEGAADAVATKVMGASLENARQKSLTAIGRAGKFPSLKELASKREWRNSVDNYGGAVTYAVSRVAVIDLVNEFGYERVFKYFRLVSTSEGETAFSEAFGYSLDVYMSRLDYKIRNEIN